MKQMIDITKLNRKGIQTRAALNAEAVRDYAELMKTDPDALPPVEVVGDHLVDGFHRVAAALSLGLTEIAADVREGDYKTALAAALKANVAHGIRRTNADKRQAMRIAWEHRDELFGHDPSEREFAAICCVSNATACNFFKDMKVVKFTTPPTVAKKTPRNRVAESADIDRFGLEIPANLQAAFASKNLAAIISLVRKARHQLKVCLETNDVSFAALAAQTTDIKLQNALADLKFAQPYCVCRMCRGTGCNACRGRGFQTKPEYDLVPGEYKADSNPLI